jgi:hypothetical protein
VLPALARGHLADTVLVAWAPKSDLDYLGLLFPDAQIWALDEDVVLMVARDRGLVHDRDNEYLLAPYNFGKVLGDWAHCGLRKVVWALTRMSLHNPHRGEPGRDDPAFPHLPPHGAWVDAAVTRILAEFAARMADFFSLSGPNRPRAPTAPSDEFATLSWANAASRPAAGAADERRRRRLIGRATLMPDLEERGVVAEVRRRVDRFEREWRAEVPSGHFFEALAKIKEHALASGFWEEGLRYYADEYDARYWKYRGLPFL